MTFGEKIQKLRKEAGLSQEELAYQLGVSRQAISKWERDNGYPETEKIVRMSKIFARCKMKLRIKSNKKVHSEDLCVRINLLQKINTERGNRYGLPQSYHRSRKR